MKRGLARSVDATPPTPLHAGLTALKIGRWEARRVRGRLFARLLPPIPETLVGLLGREWDWQNKIHVADRRNFATWFKQAKRGGPTTEAIDYRLEPRPGVLVWVRHWLQPAANAGSTSAEFFGLIQVIEEQKRAEADGLRAAESERFKLGQELHDETCQLLAGLACLTKALQSRQPPSWEEAKPLLFDLEGQLAVSLERLRTRSHALVPAPTAKAGLAESLHQLAGQTFLLYNVKIRVSLPSRLPRLGEDRVVQLHGIAHESIANAIKHGGATSLHIRLRVRGKNHVLTLEDNGRGLGVASPPPSGIGLHLMNHRAALIGGRLTVKNRRPHGVRVRVNYSVA